MICAPIMICGASAFTPQAFGYHGNVHERIRMLDIMEDHAKLIVEHHGILVK